MTINSRILLLTYDIQEETVGSDWLKHVDIVGEDSTYLSKLDNICNEIQDVKV